MTDEKMKEYEITEELKLTGFQLNVLKLLYCIATMKWGYTYGQNVYLTLLGQLLFPEKEEEND